MELPAKYKAEETLKSLKASKLEMNLNAVRIMEHQAAEISQLLARVEGHDAILAQEREVSRGYMKQHDAMEAVVRKYREEALAEQALKKGPLAKLRSALSSSVDTLPPIVPPITEGVAFDIMSERANNAAKILNLSANFMSDAQFEAMKNSSTPLSDYGKAIRAYAAQLILNQPKPLPISRS